MYVCMHECAAQTVQIPGTGRTSDRLSDWVSYVHAGFALTAHTVITLYFYISHTTVILN